MNKQTARGLAALGRGPDTELVHMTSGEVKSLQDLAKAGGGSLTLNPQTGLPEAGFLSSMLPMIIGAGLTAATGGAISPLMAGLGVGGLQGIRKGSLRDGLVAGFGAYGGAGIGSALTSAGGANLAAAGGVDPSNLAGPAVPSIEGINPSNVAASTGQKMYSGITGLGSEAGRNAFMQNIGGAKGLGIAGLAAASPMLLDTTTKQPEIKPGDADLGRRYTFAPGATGPTPAPDTPGYENQGQNFGREQTYFRPQYTPIGKEQAKSIYGFAGGGPIEQMSDANAIGMNTGYPQSGVNAGAYATPYQQPMSRNVITGAQDVAVDPYTGQEQRTAPAPQANFAEGGDVGGYTYDPVSQTYSKAGGQGITTVKPPGFNVNNDRMSDTNVPAPGPWDNMTAAQQAAFYAANPGYAAFTQAGQNLLGATFIGKLQEHYYPEFVRDERLIAQGIDPHTYLSERSVEATGPGTIGSRDTRGSNESPSGYGGSYSDRNAAAGESAASGANSGDFGGYSGSTDSSGDGTGGEARGGLNLNGKYYPPKYAQGGLSALAQGGMSNLGSYSDGGRLLRGPGDGVSDDIPATIGRKQPARLADGEFVVPARIVSELGNGSTEAGARKLYAMMERVQKARRKTVGKGKIAVNSKASKHLPA